MSIDATRIKDLSELPDLSRMEIGVGGLPKNWGFCRGGQHLDDTQWAIQHVHEDLSQDLYPLPLWVTVLLRGEVKSAKAEWQGKLKHLLGL